MKKTFLLGVGAQKAGTTWLHQYLSAQKNWNLGLRKEYHIWDALYIRECRHYIAPADDVLRYKLQNVDGAYTSYFNSLMKGDEITHTGDITPSYAGLPKFAFELIQQKLEKAGFNLKVIFLMRDPFERCWSAIRMLKRNGTEESSELELLRKLYKTKPFEFRTNYQSTIEVLESVFIQDQIYYGFYEDLFSSDRIKELSHFCECPAQPSFANKTFNAAPKLNEHALELKDEIRQYYSNVYSYCEARFPQTKQLWRE